MSHSLPADIQQRIEAQLASGSFATEEEVLREAIEALERRQHGLAELREKIKAAESDVAAGRVSSFNRDDIKSEVREHLAQRGIAD